MSTYNPIILPSVTLKATFSQAFPMWEVWTGVAVGGNLIKTAWSPKAKGNVVELQGKYDTVYKLSLITNYHRDRDFILIEVLSIKSKPIG